MRFSDSFRILVAATLAASCTYSSRPTPQVVSRNYEANSELRRVYLGEDGRKVLTQSVSRTRESVASAKQRLLASIAAECPQYLILEDGTGEDNEVGSAMQLNVFTNQFEYVPTTFYSPYYWARYRCESAPPSASRISSMDPDQFREAVVKSCGPDWQQKGEQWRQRQEARLSAAGFTAAVQIQVAMELLRIGTGDLHSGYFKALEFQPEGEQIIRAEFLHSRHLTPQDVAGIGMATLYDLGTEYNVYLKNRIKAVFSSQCLREVFK